MKITTFISSLVFLCTGMYCPPEEDINYENFEFNAPGRIEIQNDTLWVKTVISNTLLIENGEAINITELMGNAETAITLLNLYWENSFTQASPIVFSADELIPLTGDVNYQYNLKVTAKIIEGKLQNEFGIILKEKGNYFLGSAFLRNPLSFYLVPTNYNQISIKTNFANQDNTQFRFSIE